VWADGVEALDAPGAPQVWLAVASVPDLPRDDVLTEAAQEEFDEWDRSIEPFPTLMQQGYLGVGEYSVPAPGRMCFNEAVQDDSSRNMRASVVRHFYREIHVDGSAFAALPLSAPEEQSPFTIETDEFVDKVATATVNVVGWTGARTGLWGATTVTAGIVVNGTDDASLEISDFGGVDVRRRIHRRLERKWPKVVTAVELADTATVQERLAVTFRLATPLVQAFGVPYLAWLTEHGELRPYYMIRTGVNTALDWARRNRVNTAPD
jgi:hypothetical protein